MHREVKLNTTATGAGIMTTLENYPVPVRLTKDNFDFSQAKDVLATSASPEPTAPCCRTRSSCGTGPTRSPPSG